MTISEYKKLIAKESKRSKYNAKKCQYKGIVFDSQHEMLRYQQLEDMLKSGAIRNLELQKKYELIPAQYDPDSPVEYYSKGPKKGQEKPRPVLERPCYYIADFVYYDNKEKRIVVEDAKGMRTKEYQIKKKLLLYVHKIKIREV